MASGGLPRFQVRLFLLLRFHPSPSRRRRLHQPARSRFPLKPTPTGEGWRLRCFVKGDGQKTHSRAEKKRP